MKKLSILYLIGTLLIAGCSKSELDTQPNDRYTEATYWTTEKNAVAALSGCYNALMAEGLFGAATPLLEETITPNAYNSGNRGGLNVIALGTHNASSGGVIILRWQDCYKGIGRCNTLLQRIDAVPVSTEALKDRMKAEAKFLRALYYTTLEMYYGGVPLILDAPDFDAQADLPRNTREEVVTQILKDLDEAAAVLPLKYSGADVGRATKGAALALKARVLLFEASPLNNPSNDVNKWTDAANAARAVIELPGTGYALFPNYRSLFLPANENSAESVFDVQFSVVANGLGNSFDVVVGSFNSNAPLHAMIDAYDMKDGLPASQSPLYDASKPYDNRDPRMYQTIVYPGDMFLGAVTTTTDPFKITGYGVKKYTLNDKEPNPNPIIVEGKSETNFMVIRYADVLLMYAEAQNEVLSAPQDDANAVTIYSAINMVRQRAGLTPYEIPPGKTKAEMREIIRHERRIEFAMEGFYYNDIRRWKIAETVLPGYIYNSQNLPIVTRTFNPARDYWWPVPQTQRDVNANLSQNINY